MSSRNKYLSPAERKQAPELYAALEAAAERVRVEQPAAGEVERMIRERLAQRAPLGEIDYVKAVDPETMADVERAEPPVLLALAVRFGRARLIDNLLVEAEPANS
jgi:pantoate--beta-alanine ligase